MAQITTGIGLISGLNTGDIINSLISLDSAPVTLLQAQSASANAQQNAYATLTNSLSDMQSIGNSLALPTTFQGTATNSSDPSVLTATSAVGAAVGSYQLQVASLVTTQQSISHGFADATNSLVGAGTLTFTRGGGEISTQTALNSLNGGAGAQRGQFRITDRSGSSTVIDTSTDVSLDDVVKQINNALNINVKASVDNNKLVITDSTGKTSSNLIVQDIGGGSAAAGLGIVGNSTSGTITGTDINFVSTSTALSALNDGQGVRTTTAGQDDFQITLGNGTNVRVSLAGASTVGDVLSAINTAGGGNLNAAISSDGSGISITDSTGTPTITALNNSNAAADLGLTTPATGSTITGNPLLSSIDSVLVSSLNGGAGLALGAITVTDRAGHSGQIDLSGATSVSDILNDINNNTSGIDISASINSAGTGLQISDSSGGTGNLTIADANGGTTAEDLGINGTFTNSQPTVDGGNLNRQYVSNNTPLADYNGGQGVTPGAFSVTNSQGISATVDLSQGTYNTIGDVLAAINAKNIGVTASINSQGNGIALTDNAGGANQLKVTDLGGVTAANLNIAGTATGNILNGAQTNSVTVTATDTLTTLAAKINSANAGVTASVINDGSGQNGYRLSITAVNTGADGRVLIDDGTTNLGTSNLVDAQNAAVFLGGGTNNSGQPLLVQSSKNQITNLIKGVTINLVGASANPVTLSVTNDPSNISTQLTQFVTDFNALVDNINSDTQFDTSTNTGGVLLGDATTQQVQSKLYNILNNVVQGAGQYKLFSDIGITITDGAKLQFDQNAFTAAYATNPTAVQNLFTQATTGLASAITTNINSLTDPVNGVITLEDQTLDTRIQQYSDSINNLNDLLALKKQQLQNSFNNMETTLASLQSQGQLIGSISSAATAVSNANKSSSSSSSSSSNSS